jgi:uncharacterized protein
MKVLIAGGTGFIGQWVIDHWLADSHQITVVTRDVDHVPKRWQQKLEVMTWDALERVGIDFIRDFNAVINFSGANVGEKRWTASRKEELLSSRLNTSMVLASLCQQLGADSPVLINASGVGVYGTQAPVKDTLPEALTEQSAICLDPNDFMASLACRWEQSMQGAIDAGVRVVCMRLGMVLGRKGGALHQMSTAVRFGMGAVMGSGDQPLAWVCIEDVRRALAFMISHGQMHGAINVVSPCAVTHKTFMRFLGKACRRPVWLRMPAWLVRLLFGQMADELILNGQHVLPKKLLDAGFQFEYDDLKSALHFCLSSDQV